VRNLTFILGLLAALAFVAMAPASVSAEAIAIKGTESGGPNPAGGLITCVTPPGMAPVMVPRVNQSQGTFEGLGKATTVLVHESCAVTARGVETVAHGIRTFDSGEWYISWNGIVNPATGALTIEGLTLDFGTGRFAGATASLSASGTVDATGKLEYTVTGTLSTAAIAPPSTGDGGLSSSEPDSTDGSFASWAAIAAAAGLSVLFAARAVRVRS
jgi:hypothetical protein